MIEALAKGCGGMGIQTLPVGVDIGLIILERNLAMEKNVEVYTPCYTDAPAYPV